MEQFQKEPQKTPQHHLSLIYFRVKSNFPFFKDLKKKTLNLGLRLNVLDIYLLFSFFVLFFGGGGEGGDLSFKTC